MTSSGMMMRRWASVLVMAEYKANGDLAAGTTSSVTAAVELASRIGGETPGVDVLVAGGDAARADEETRAVTAASKLAGVSRVIHAKINSSDSRGYLAMAEGLSGVVAKVMNSEKLGGFSHVVANASTTGKDVMPRIAALFDVAQVSDIVEVKDGGKTFVRPIYAGNALATVECVETEGKPIIVTTRSTAFPPAAERADGGEASVEHVDVDVSDITSQAQWLREDKKVSERPELASASVVISGGRGLKSGENFSMLEELADQLGGAVGASRAAVDAGMVPNDLQVGQTGKVVAPNLYVAVGISGAIQHLSGMKDSKTIVAINKDADAPIFQVADYGLVGDLFEAVPEMISKTKKT